MTSRGWTASREEFLQGVLLEWVYESTRGSIVPDLGEFMEATEGVDEETLEGIVAALESRGWIQVTWMMGGLDSSSAQLTDIGRAVVRARLDRRNNWRERSVAAREALLDWFYDQKRRGVHHPVTKGFLSDTRGHFEGDPLTEQEFNDAARHLFDVGLVKGTRSAQRFLVRGEITTTGETVVEDYDGSLAPWRQSQRSGGQQITTHFHGPVSGQVGIGEQVTQTQHQGFDVDTVLRLIEDAREAAADVPAGEQALVYTYLDVLQAEVTAAEPNPVMVKGTGDRLKAIAAKVGDHGLAASIQALVVFLLRALGIG